ncbi:MAG: metal ABC transporter permease [Elusimicrobiota bacterium]|jgi:zinc transport system permease protein|nr:metal ABC transporter permease [Elusimicrobiota bacterium]
MSIAEFLSFAFVQRALIAGALIAATTAALGVFLVLKRLSLIGDSLSHVALSGVALGLITKASPVFVAVPVVMGSALLILKIKKHARVYTDGALGIVSALGISAGLIIAALAGGFNADLMSFLFGGILTVSRAELLLAAALAAAAAGIIYIFYNDLTALVFDENFARAAGVDTEKTETILVLISAAAVVVAMKVVGIMLVSAMIIIPPSAALLLAADFKRAVMLACAFSVCAVLLGIYFAFLLNLPAGAVIIIINILILIFCSAVRKYVIKKRTSARID